MYHDLLGIMHHPHHEKHVPSFCKRYAKLGSEINKALEQYNTEVKEGLFPTENYSPYKMSDEETRKFISLMAIDEAARGKLQEGIEKKLREADEYEVSKLY